jgi:hypothetical protein
MVMTGCHKRGHFPTGLEAIEGANPKQRWVMGEDAYEERAGRGEPGDTLLEIATRNRVNADVIAVLRDHVQ